VDDAYELAAAAARIAPGPEATPAELRLEPGTSTTLRGEFGRALHHLQTASGGAFLVAAADLVGSTSVSTIAGGFAGGFWNARTNPEARLLSVGGICEDGIAGILSGITAYGHDLGVGSSYGAFMAPLGHIAARLHAIGAQARKAVSGDPYKPMFLVCAHAGLKTGEDGPTHADPQPLQILQEDFPKGTAVSLTPWEPQEIWTLTAAALAQRPAVISMFVTRPAEPVLDRPALGLAPAEAAVTGVYALRETESPDVTVVLQESAVAYAFVQGALPLLEQKGIDALVYYVASAELFDLLPEEDRRAIFPEARAAEAIGVTGFTLPTLYRWVTSEAGRAASLYPFRRGHYLGSGPGEMVLAEAGLDGESQARAIADYVAARAVRR
jgi:transketolase